MFTLRQDGLASPSQPLVGSHAPYYPELHKKQARITEKFPFVKTSLEKKKQ
jgi:hypothetical protein